MYLLLDCSISTVPWVRMKQLTGCELRQKLKNAFKLVLVHLRCNKQLRQWYTLLHFTPSSYSSSIFDCGGILPSNTFSITPGHMIRSELEAMGIFSLIWRGICAVDISSVIPYIRYGNPYSASTGALAKLLSLQHLSRKRGFWQEFPCFHNVKFSQFTQFRTHSAYDFPSIH